MVVMVSVLRLVLTLLVFIGASGAAFAESQATRFPLTVELKYELPCKIRSVPIDGFTVWTLD
jgi:hypothetical protein